jgi:hypothetical protein
VIQPKRIELELGPWNEFFVATWGHRNVDRDRPAEGEFVTSHGSVERREGVEIWTLR